MTNPPPPIDTQLGALKTVTFQTLAGLAISGFFGTKSKSTTRSFTNRYSPHVGELIDNVLVQQCPYTLDGVRARSVDIHLYIRTVLFAAHELLAVHHVDGIAL
jgi:hypothetical protein